MNGVLEPVETSRRDRALTILQRAVCLTLACHYLGNDRKVKVKDLVDAAAPDHEAEAMAVDEAQFTATKKLLDPRVLRPAKRISSQAKAYLRGVAVSAHRVFGERSYLIPNEKVAEVEAELTRLAAEAFAAAAVIADSLEDAIAKAEVALGPKMFKRSDYWTAEHVRSAFSLDWAWVSFEAPDRLDTIDRAVAQRAAERTEARFASAFDEVVGQMREEALAVVSELADRLGETEVGKPKVLRPSALKSLQAYVAQLPTRNMAGDDALPAALGRLEALTQGLPVEAVRDSAALRSAIRTAALEAQAVLVGLVEDAPRRSIAFGPMGV